MFAIGTKDLVTGLQATKQDGSPLPAWVTFDHIEPQPSGDVSLILAAGAPGCISWDPAGFWTFGATNRDAYQRARQNGNVIAVWTRPTDPVRTYMLIGLPNG